MSKLTLHLRATAGILLAISILRFAHPASADMGPKPTIDFRNVYQVKDLTLVEAELIHYLDPECQQTIDPDEFDIYLECTSDSFDYYCQSMAYSYSYGPYLGNHPLD